MSPEAKIRPLQVRQILRWIGENNHGVDGIKIDSGGEISISGEKITLVFSEMVRNEPLVLRQTTLPGGNEESVLWCSKRHAEELEQLGIVEFPKPKQRK